MINFSQVLLLLFLQDFLKYYQKHLMMMKIYDFQQMNYLELFIFQMNDLKLKQNLHSTQGMEIEIDQQKVYFCWRNQSLIHMAKSWFVLE